MITNEMIESVALVLGGVRTNYEVVMDTPLYCTMDYELVSSVTYPKVLKGLIQDNLSTSRSSPDRVKVTHDGFSGRMAVIFGMHCEAILDFQKVHYDSLSRTSTYKLDGIWINSEDGDIQRLLPSDPIERRIRLSFAFQESFY